MIEIIPAIDIIEGKCVRLSKGDYDSKKVYNENPVEVAKEFEANGIRRLHANITTGLKENKFGINLEDLDNVLDAVNSLPNVKLLGLHFHIGSQILDMGDFVGLCNRVNEIQERMNQRNTADPPTFV